MRNYTAFKTALLYNITVKTDCKPCEYEKLVEYEVRTNVNALILIEFESFEDYINRCMDVYEKSDNNELTLICVLLAVELAKQRSIKYPFESWIDDNKYYISLIKQIEPFVEVFKNKNWGTPHKLTEKILEQIKNNHTRSLNMNKTAEELYAFASDDDGEWTTYIKDEWGEN